MQAETCTDIKQHQETRFVFMVLEQTLAAAAAHTHVLLFPLAEVYFEGRHGELLAHAALVMHSFGDQRWTLRAVPAYREGKNRSLLLKKNPRFSSNTFMVSLSAKNV